MANGIQVPAASIEQPRGDRVPVQNTYSPQARIGGAIRGQFESGPAVLADTSTGMGLAALGRGIGDLGQAWERETQRRQNLEAMEEVAQFKDRERDMFAQMEQMKGKVGYEAAVQFAEDWYHTEGENLLNRSRGRYQEMYYQSSFLQARDSGMNRAFGYSLEQGEIWKDSVVDGQMATIYASVDADPDNFQAAMAEARDVIRAANPGLGTTAKEMVSDASIVERAVDANLARGGQEGIDAARRVVDNYQGVEGGGGEGSPANIPKSAEPYIPLVEEASGTYGVPQDVLWGVMGTESSWGQNTTSPTGVKGLMQVTTATYKALGFTGDRTDPRNSMMAAAKYLSQLHDQYGNWTDAFTAYNSGPGGVTFLKTGTWPQSTLNYFAKHGISVAQKSREARNYAPTVMKNMRAVGGGGTGDSGTVLALRKKIAQQQSLYERSAADGAKAVADDLETNLNGIAMNGIGLDGWEASYAAAKARGAFNEDFIRQTDMQIEAARDVYEETASPDGRFKSFAEAREALNAKWNPGELADKEPYTKEYADKAATYQGVMKQLDAQEERFKEQSIDYVAKTAQAEYDTMVKEGMVPEGREAVTRIEVARRVAAEKGGFTPTQTRNLPALTTEDASRINRAWTEAGTDQKRQMLAEMEQQYGPYYGRVLTDAKIGGGALVFATVNGNSKEEILLRNLALVVDGKKVADLAGLPGVKENKDMVDTKVNALFETSILGDELGDASPLTVLGELYRQRDDQNYSDQLQGMRETILKIGYELLDRGQDLDDVMKTIRSGFSAGYDSIVDPDTAIVSIPVDVDGDAVVRGMLEVKEQMGALWQDGSFFANGDDNGVVIDTPEGIAQYVSFDDLIKAGHIDFDPLSGSRIEGVGAKDLIAKWKAGAE